MQGVTEFVKQRARIVQRQQRRFSLGRFREIADIVDDRYFADRAVLQRQLVLRLERTHPCAGTLGGTGEIIAKEHGFQIAVVVSDFENPHIRVIGSDILDLDSPNSEEPVGHIETGLDDFFQLQIGLQLSL